MTEEGEKEEIIENKEQEENIKNESDNKKGSGIMTRVGYLISSDEKFHKELEGRPTESETETDTDNENPEEGRRSFMRRTFGPMKDGSIRGAIFSVSSLALGTGCLSLPVRFTQMSLTLGAIFLAVGALVAFWTLTLMIKSAENAKKLQLGSSYDYSRLVKNTLGNGPAKFLDCVIMIYIFGVLITYQVIIYTTIGRIAYDVHYKDEYDDFDSFVDNVWGEWKFKIPIMYGFVALVIPLCLLKDQSKMKFTSLVSVCSLLYVIGVIVAESPGYYKYYKEHTYEESKESTHANWFDVTKAFGSDMIFFSCLATIFFSFTCHVGAFPAYKTLRNRSVRRIFKVFRRSIILDLVIYYLVSICGFITQPIDCPDLIIYRTAKDDGIDYFMTIAKGFICFNLMMSTPTNYNAFRLSFFEIVWGTSDITNKRNIIVTLSALLLSCTVGVVYQKIIDYITLEGGFLSVVITFLMPGLMYVKTSGQPYTSTKNIIVLCATCCLCSIGFIGGVETIKGIFKK